MGEAKRKKEFQKEQLHKRLMLQETVNFFMLFVIADVMVDKQMQQILGALADKLVQLGFDPKMIESELDAFATTVQSIQAAKLAKPEEKEDTNA